MVDSISMVLFPKPVRTPILFGETGVICFCELVEGRGTVTAETDMGNNCVGDCYTNQNERRRSGKVAQNVDRRHSRKTIVIERLLQSAGYLRNCRGKALLTKIHLECRLKAPKGKADDARRALQSGIRVAEQVARRDGVLGKKGRARSAHHRAKRAAARAAGIATRPQSP